MSNYVKMPVHLLSDFFEKDAKSQIDAYHQCLNPFTYQWWGVEHGLGLCRRHAIIYGEIMYQKGYESSFWAGYPTLYSLVIDVIDDHLLWLIDADKRGNFCNYRGEYWFTDGWRRVAFAVMLKRELEYLYASE